MHYIEYRYFIEILIFVIYFSEEVVIMKSAYIQFKNETKTTMTSLMGIFA